MTYITFHLSSSHNKSVFSCGKPMLNDYIPKLASQDMKKKVATCFVLSDESKTVKGYYTLSSDAIIRSAIPDEVIQKLKLPYYSNMPVFLLGRLAIDKQFSGKGLGADLLLDALKRCFDIASSSVAAMAVIVDPLDKEAESFYIKYGFISLPDSKRMFLAMSTIGKLFK